MTIHTFPGAGPAHRILSGNTASPEQRRVAHIMADEARHAAAIEQTRRLTDAELATLDMPFIQRPDPDDNNGRGVIGWLLIAMVIGAALAVWVLL